MLILGIILLVVGYLLPLHILFVIGAVLAVVGLVLLLLPYVGVNVGGGRRFY